MPAPFQVRDLHTNTDLRQTMRGMLATHESTRRLYPATSESDAYNAGFRDALLLLAEHLGVSLGIPAASHYMER